jgi:hypothetical protein
MTRHGIAEIKWTHLLYLGGDELDWERVISAVPSYQLGTHCWLVRPEPDREQFFARIEAALPQLPNASEILFCPVSNARFLRSGQGGLGLDAWLKEYDCAQ